MEPLVKFLHQDLFNFDLDEWQEHFCKLLAKDTVNLISEEKFSGQPVLSYANNDTILAKLSALFPNAKILICVRSQPQWLLSMYKQYVKEGGWKSLDEYLSASDGIPGNAYDVFLESTNIEVGRYSRFVRAYQDSFGPDNVEVLFFEELFDSCVLQQAFENLGAKAPWPSFDFSQRVNLGYDSRQIQFATFMNRFLRSRRNPNSLIPSIWLPLIGRIDAVRFKSVLRSRKSRWMRNSKDLSFSERALSELNEYYRHDNLKLQELVGRPLPRSFFNPGI